MNEPKTPERLRAFRAQYEAAHPIGSRLATIQLFVVVAGFIAILTVLYTDKPNGRRPGLSADEWRALAAHLAQKNMPMEAVDAYGTYLDNAVLPLEQRVATLFTMGKLAEEGGDPQAALAYCYQAEALLADSEVKSDIDKLIITCLERLNRSADLKHELRQRASLTHQAQSTPSGETVLAEVGDLVITERDLDAELEKLPPAMRETIDTPEQRVDMLKNMVADKLLLEKALRLRLDEDPVVQEQLAEQRDALIVRRLIDDEIDKNVKITEADAERYYKAESEQFKDEDGEVKPFEAVKQQAMFMLQRQKEQEQIQALIDSTLESEQVKLYTDRLTKQDDPK